METVVKEWLMVTSDLVRTTTDVTEDIVTLLRKRQFVHSMPNEALFQ